MSSSLSRLYTALQVGDVNYLREISADIFMLSRFSEPYGWTPLTIAAKFNQLECVKTILASGVKVDQLDCENKSALMYAIDQNSLDICEALIESGANVNLTRNVRGWSLQTPARHAFDCGSSKTLKVLLDHGAIAPDATFIFNAVREHGGDSYFLATMDGRANCIFLLIDRALLDPQQLLTDLRLLNRPHITKLAVAIEAYILNNIRGEKSFPVYSVANI